MTAINIPGDDIESAQNNLQQVLQLLGNKSASVPDLDEALGGDKVANPAGKEFESRWSDGRTQLQQEGQDIVSALKKIISTFTDTDNQTAGQLTSSNGSGSQSG